MTEWEQGIQAFRRGALREAADRLQTAADDNERTVIQASRFKTLAYLGAALYALGRSAEAIPVFEQAVRLCPAPLCPADLGVNLANAYLAGGQPDKAQSLLEQTVQDYPGHLEARMILDRLSQRSAGQPLTGSAFGASPEAVRRYLQTLTFSAIPSGGWDPAQVRLALSQIERHVEFLVEQIVSRDEAIEGLRAEVDYLRQQTIQAAPGADAASAGLSPLEALLRQKPASSS